MTAVKKKRTGKAAYEVSTHFLLLLSPETAGGKLSWKEKKLGGDKE